MLGFFGSFLIVCALSLRLLHAHLRRQKAWDRPAFARSRAYATLRPAASWLLLSCGLLCIALFSLPALLSATAGLAALALYLRRVRSPEHALQRIERDRAGLAGKFPHAAEAELTARVLRSWHPEWPVEIVERVVQDHPALQDLARMVVRMEREL